MEGWPGGKTIINAVGFTNFFVGNGFICYLMRCLVLIMDYLNILPGIVLSMCVNVSYVCGCYVHVCLCVYTCVYICVYMFVFKLIITTIIGSNTQWFFIRSNIAYCFNFISVTITHCR